MAEFFSPQASGLADATTGSSRRTLIAFKRHHGCRLNVQRSNGKLGELLAHQSMALLFWTTSSILQLKTTLNLNLKGHQPHCTYNGQGTGDNEMQVKKEKANSAGELDI